MRNVGRQRPSFSPFEQRVGGWALTPLVARNEGRGSCWVKRSWRGGFGNPPRRILHCLLVRDKNKDNKKDERTLYAQPLPPASYANNIYVHGEGDDGRKCPLPLKTRGGGSCWPKSSWRGGFPNPPRHVLHCLLVRYSKNDIKKDERTSYAHWPLPPVSCANNIHVHVAARNEGWWVTFKLAKSGWQGRFPNPPRRVLYCLLVRDNENDNKEDECALYAQPLLCILCQHPCSQGGGGQKRPSSRNEGWWVALAKVVNNEGFRTLLVTFC